MTESQYHPFATEEGDRKATHEVVSRIMKYRGKRRKEVGSPHITAREAIILAHYIYELQDKIIDLGGAVAMEDYSDVR